MNQRHYQLFALAILLGAPLLVSLLANAIPAFHDMAPVSEASAGVRPDVAPAPSDPLANARELAPPPPAPHMAQAMPQTDGSFSAAPSVVPAGMSVEGTDPAAMSGEGDPAVPGAAAPAPRVSPTLSYVAPGAPGSGLSEEELIRRQSQAR